MIRFPSQESCWTDGGAAFGLQSTMSLLMLLRQLLQSCQEQLQECPYESRRWQAEFQTCQLRVKLQFRGGPVGWMHRQVLLQKRSLCLDRNALTSTHLVW